MLFQLTRPRGTRQSTQTHGSGMSRFNSRVRGGRDPERCRVAADTPQFQLTRPRGTRLILQTLLRLSKCFNSRVRGGRDQSLNSASYKQVVSTHASAGDATCRGDFLLHPHLVSTHASAGDATQTQMLNSLGEMFQLTRPRGTLRRRMRHQTMTMKFQLTRPRGTRHRRDYLHLAHTGFNSRVRGGRDAFLAQYHTEQTFQLTRPRGTRPMIGRRFDGIVPFQLTRPRGTRREDDVIPALAAVSTHASAGDATPCRMPFNTFCTCFNSRVRGGRDLSCVLHRHRQMGFNSRVRGGRDQYQPVFFFGDRCFNSRVRGGRDILKHWKPQSQKFQLTRPRGTRL